jgi:hypothetical protein
MRELNLGRAVQEPWTKDQEPYRQQIERIYHEYRKLS